MKSQNEVVLAGRLGRDPERFGNGPYRLSLATGGGKKKDGSGEWPTDWHTVVCWPNHVSVDGLHKGEFVKVHGRLSYREWTAKDGTKRTSAEVVAFSVSFPEDDQPKAAKPAMPEQSDYITDSDIPF